VAEVNADSADKTPPSSIKLLIDDLQKMQGDEDNDEFAKETHRLAEDEMQK